MNICVYDKKNVWIAIFIWLQKLQRYLFLHFAFPNPVYEFSVQVINKTYYIRKYIKIDFTSFCVDLQSIIAGMVHWIHIGFNQIFSGIFRIRMFRLIQNKKFVILCNRYIRKTKCFCIKTRGWKYMFLSVTYICPHNSGYAWSGRITPKPPNEPSVFGKTASHKKPPISNPSGGETRILWDNRMNAISNDALDPCIHYNECRGKTYPCLLGRRVSFVSSMKTVFNCLFMSALGNHKKWNIYLFPRFRLTMVNTHRHRRQWSLPLWFVLNDQDPKTHFPRIVYLNNKFKQLETQRTVSVLECVDWGLW